MRLLTRFNDWRKTRKIKTPPNLLAETQEVIERINQELDGDFITYWGAVNSAIAGSDSLVFRELLQNRKHDKLYLFIKSNGGSGESSLRTLHLLRQYYKEIIALVPLDCASAATMLALGADLIQMGPLSYLTAVDTSITHDLSPIDKDEDLVSVSQNELDRVLRLWKMQTQDGDLNAYKSLYKYIHPLVFGAVDRASSLSIRLTSEILAYHMQDEQKINQISNELNSEYPSHGYPITMNEALKLGLNIQAIEPSLNDLLIELNHLYSQMAQRCFTDVDEYKHYNKQIYKVMEIAGLQVFYQVDKIFVWRREDRQWVSTFDESSWMKHQRDGITKFHIR